MYWALACARVTLPLHAEDAEARLLLWSAARHGEREAQHAAGIRGIDDAVVPEPRGGVVGVSLALVLVADRRLEGLLLVLRPGALPGLDAVALHGGEHRGRLLATHDRDARIGPGP